MYIAELSSFLASDSNFLRLISRAGGGGSSSGGSGDGAGSLIILLGYVPMHFIGHFLNKKLPIATASVIGWPLAAFYAFLWLNFLPSFGFITGVAAMVGVGAGLYGWFDRIAKLSKRAKQDLAVAAQNDGAWNIDLLNKQVSETFLRYQADWSNNNAEAMKAYLTPNYAYKSQLMILALQQLSRRNIISDCAIKSIDIISVSDQANNAEDSFTAHISARCKDDLVDTKTNSYIFQDSSTFNEEWRFVRNGQQSWALDSIAQGTEDKNRVNIELMRFAQKYNYFFSADWGWLLLPARGQLFGSGKFGTSDINNHVIGVYNNILIQLYNYIPRPSKDSSSESANYIIAQVALPKYYGNIVVRRKHILSLNNNKGLTKVSMEWGEFNKLYEVWASDMERVTSFELLNPSFMVKLRELPFEVNIEVVDNIVYLYSSKIKPSENAYETMLEILRQAFKEMRM